ncbi:MAG: hypothetical protein ABMB14_25885, partial [Myxococcota bacterium]
PAIPEPEVVVVPPAPPAPTEPETGLVRVNAGDYVADVYLRGTRMGDTRSDLRLPVGTHELQLRSPLLEAETVKVTVASGERRIETVKLRPKPSRVVFSRAIPGDCAVEVNGRAVGTVGGLDWRWTVERPDQPTDVRVGCADGRAADAHWNALTLTEVVFPELSGPRP